MLRIDRIKKELNEKINISHLEVIDDSKNHIGHAGYKEGGQSHYKIIVVSEDFSGITKIKRHQIIYSALKSEFLSGLHALA